MARACAEGNGDFFPAAQAPPKLVPDGGNSEAIPKDHATFKSWSRSDLQKYLNDQVGGINKFANYSKSRLIERLLLIGTGPKKRTKKTPASRTSRREKEVAKPEDFPPATTAQSLRKKPRKASQVCRLPPLESESFEDRLCDNSACRARLSAKELFCKRCSCAICKRFDDNKDPSLWIECSCGSSCHLECALWLRAAGVVKQQSTIQLDGCFFCVACGLISGLLRCWKKLLSVAKDARRINVFCGNLSLAFRLLDGTSKYKKLHDIVADAVKELERDFGPGGLTAAIHARGLVTRLSCGARVQNLIGSAMDKAASWLEEEEEKQQVFATKGGALERIYAIEFDDVTSGTAMVSWRGSEKILGEEVIGHSIWCRATAAIKFPGNPVCSVTGEVTKALITGLHPGVDYDIRLVPLGKSGELGRVGASFSTPKVERDPWFFHRLLENGEGDTSFRIRDIVKLCHASLEQEVNTRMASENDSQQDLCRPVEEDVEDEMRVTSVEEVKHVISETVPLSSKRNAKMFRRGSKDEEVLYCLEDMDEVLEDVEVGADSILSFKTKLVGMFQEHPQVNVSQQHLEQRTDQGLEQRIEIEIMEQHKNQGRAGKENKDLLTSETQNRLISREKEQHQLQPQHQLVVVQHGNVKFIRHQKLKHCELKNFQTKKMIFSAPEIVDAEKFVPQEFESARLQQEKKRQLLVDGSGKVQLVKKRKKMDKPDVVEHLSSAPTPCSDEKEEKHKCWTEAFKSFEFSVKVIVWLEREGYLESMLRLKLLTWLGFGASDEEKEMVFVYMRTLVDDPESLARQLKHTFQERASAKRETL